MNRSVFAFAAAACAAGCGSSSSPKASSAPATHSASLAISTDGATLYVTQPDNDSVSFIDRASHAITREVLLDGMATAQDPTTKRFDPAVGPRALALNSQGTTLYVTGQRSGHVYAVDTATATVKTDAPACSEPVGVLVSPDDQSVFVACAQDDEVVELKASDLSLVASAACSRKPWALAWAADGKTLLATHFLGPGVTAFNTAPLAVQTVWPVPDLGPRTDPTEPHGQVRGIYDAVVRPGTSELWVAHIMLGTDTPQPTLDFEETVFPSLSIFDETGNQITRLSVAPNEGDNGAFGDIVSGPRAIAFSDDGKLAFVVDSDSEDVLIVDADRRVEAQIIRPLPGHLPEGIVWSQGEIFVQERNSEDIAAFRIEQGDAGVTVTPDGTPFPSLGTDPMPANLRLGQKLFYSANSDDVPITQNHWVACATCHLEGRSDAVTWLFAQGPRDTPTNAGGLLDTGFLFRTADRNQVQDYWKTIDIEQGGDFSATSVEQQPLLKAIADYANYAIPTPVPPRTDPSLVAQGKMVFANAGCGNCHLGPALTDSGMANASLDLGGAIVSSATVGGVLLHDVGTCVTDGPWPDVPHQDIASHARPACAFDTPALRGLWDSAPYFHDGSAATLDAVIPVMLQASAPAGGTAPVLSASDEQALVEYLKSL
jgi:YVTN family beta-propeller protein